MHEDLNRADKFTILKQKKEQLNAENMIKSLELEDKLLTNEPSDEK